MAFRGITSAITSVFGRTGTVVATTGDYTAAQVTNAADVSSGTIALVGAAGTPIKYTATATTTGTAIVDLITAGGTAEIIMTAAGTLNVGFPGVTGNVLSIMRGGSTANTLVLQNGGVATAPAASSTPTLALGTAYQNVLGYDILLTVYLNITVNTSGVVKLGVGPTTTPTQQTIITGSVLTGIVPIPIWLPNQYYALLSISGTITDAIIGQIAMPL